MLSAVCFSYTLFCHIQMGRKVLKKRKVWLICIKNAQNPYITGWGEAAPLPKISIDDLGTFESTLQKICHNLTNIALPKTTQAIQEIVNTIPLHYPSIRFGIETALYDLKNEGHHIIFSTLFCLKKKTVPINGLISLNTPKKMLRQVRKNIKEGFTCIKLKISRNNLDELVNIIKFIHKRYPQIIIRLDANGSLFPEEVLSIMYQLTPYHIQAIEQPIMSGQLAFLQKICAKSPIPIALDEELVNIHTKTEKINFLKKIRPQYIVLKPTLIGGLAESQTWIQLANKYNIGWWLTSSLESNIGLNAICQFAALHQVTIHQGFSTGNIYKNNITSPLVIKKGEIQYDNSKNWQIPLPLKSKYL